MLLSKKNCNFAHKFFERKSFKNMPKQNSAILLNKYIWLIDTIYSAGHITRDEIDRRWCRSLLSEDEMSIPPRTFHRWRIAIEELFQISIEYDKWRGYYIEDRSDIERNSMRKWLINTFAVNNLINEGEHLRKHISFEEMPSGQRFLTTILESIRDRVALHVTHKGFNKPEPTTFMLKPYGLKVFKQRWYVLAESEYPDHRLLVYALDRFESMERTEEPYEIPEDFDVADYFRSSYGVTGIGNERELVHLKVDASQVPYFRSLPLHRSQKEEETAKDYSIFSYYVVPTYELRQEILSHGANVEVVSPKTLREQIKEEVKKMNKLYKYNQ